MSKLLKQITVAMAFFVVTLFSNTVYASIETVSLRIVDVTPISFSVVWMTNVEGVPNIDVYSDVTMQNKINKNVKIIPYIDLSQELQGLARQKGIMKITVTGLNPDSTYYFNAITSDEATGLTDYSTLTSATTASKILTYSIDDVQKKYTFTNNLATFNIFLPPSDDGILLGKGSLILLDTDTSLYPLSAFIGNEINAPEGYIDLNNLFNIAGTSLQVFDGSRTKLLVYRGTTFSTLLHYRKISVHAGSGMVEDVVKGFFADINLDGNVDVIDFELFKEHYMLEANDISFNPDFDFYKTNKVDVFDFSKFSKEYGRIDVE